jgi:AcrR family transcriptional regulator
VRYRTFGVDSFRIPEDTVARARQPAHDRRVQKTRQVLYEALDALIVEKNFDAIAVRELLDRANVGRSTFYTHYRGKAELLDGRLHDVIGAPGTPSPAAESERHERILSFSLPMLDHIDRHRRAVQSAMDRRGQSVLHEHLRRVIAGTIEEALQLDRQGRGELANGMPRELLVQYLSSTFVLVLTWWLESGSHLTPSAADGLFRALALPPLREALSGGDSQPGRRAGQAPVEGPQRCAFQHRRRQEMHVHVSESLAHEPMGLEEYERLFVSRHPGGGQLA